MADTDRLAGLRRAQGAWPVVASYVDDDADHLYSGGDDDDSDGAVLDELLTFAAVKLAFNTALAPFDTAVVLQQVQYQPLVHDADGRLVVDASQDAAATTAEAGADGTETDIVGAANTDLPALQVRADQAATVREYLPERLEPSLPVLLGTLDAVRTVARREGLLALWNGNLLQTWVDVSSIMVQPSLESALNDAFGLDDTTPFELLPPPRWPNLGTILVSHIATALVMSPIKVLRTRCCVGPGTVKHARTVLVLMLGSMTALAGAAVAGSLYKNHRPRAPSIWASAMGSRPCTARRAWPDGTGACRRRCSTQCSCRCASRSSR